MKNPIFKTILRSAPRVQRGGSWYDDALYVRVSGRDGSDPAVTSSDLGFRVFRSLK